MIRHIVELQHILLRAFADANDAVGMVAGILPLYVVNLAVVPVIHIRKGLERHIVDGHH